MGHPLFPAVVVDGRPIPPAEIAAEAQNHSAPKTKPGWAWRKAARALAVKRLLLDEADRRGLAAAPRRLGAGKQETDDEARIRDLLELAVAVDPPDAEAIRAAYDRDPGRYRTPALFEASHILVAAPPADAAARAAARERAEAAIAALQTEPERFERLARSESDCPSRDQGGRLGQFVEGDMAAEIDAALLTLADGAISERPVETRFGFHILRLDARAEGRTPPFEAVRDRIAEALEMAAWTRAAHAFAADLVAQAKISGVEFEAALAGVG